MRVASVSGRLWLEGVHMRSLILMSILILMKIEQIMIQRAVKRGIRRRGGDPRGTAAPR